LLTSYVRCFRAFFNQAHQRVRIERFAQDRRGAKTLGRIGKAALRGARHQDHRQIWMALVQRPDQSEPVHGAAQHQIRNDKIDGILVDAVEASSCVGSGPNVKFGVVKDRAEKSVRPDRHRPAGIPPIGSVRFNRDIHCGGRLIQRIHSV
jgi:hypothetical protein